MHMKLHELAMFPAQKLTPGSPTATATNDSLRAEVRQRFVTPSKRCRSQDGSSSHSEPGDSVKLPLRACGPDTGFPRGRPIFAGFLHDLTTSS